MKLKVEKEPILLVGTFHNHHFKAGKGHNKQVSHLKTVSDLSQTDHQAGWLASPTRRLHLQQPISHTQGPSQALRHKEPHICSAELCTITRVAAHSWRSFRDLSSPAQGLGTALVAKITPGNIYSSTGYCIQPPRAHRSRRLFINTDFFWYT